MPGGKEIADVWEGSGTDGRRRRRRMMMRMMIEVGIRCLRKVKRKMIKRADGGMAGAWSNLRSPPAGDAK